MVKKDPDHLLTLLTGSVDLRDDQDTWQQKCPVTQVEVEYDQDVCIFYFFVSKSLDRKFYI